jgi:flagellar biosynthetic protein FliR
MPNEATLYGFLLVLARVSGIFVFAPMPGVRDAPAMMRVFLSLAITISLYPLWPRPATLTFAIFSEAAIGITIGLAVALTLEALQMAAQIAGLQAGFGYASTVDPTSQADSSVLIVLAQLFSGLMFFAAGLDREVLRACAHSLETFPPGEFVLTGGLGIVMMKLAGGMFAAGVRLALPVIALLGMVDVALALLGRINAQLQLLTLAMPVKLLASLALFAMLAALFQRVFVSYAVEALGTLARVLAHGR